MWCLLNWLIELILRKWKLRCGSKVAIFIDQLLVVFMRLLMLFAISYCSYNFFFLITFFRK